ncbi:MAG: ribbon-helix-helix domain-containing protein [Desulfurococcales archaeon]|nr:ribbon-helix-helix domain-containing protein [Desulfurococcales archaeon]
MRLVTVKMPEVYVEGIEELVRAGRYTSRSEAIRVAVRELLRRELWGAGPLAERGWLEGVASHA